MILPRRLLDGYRENALLGEIRRGREGARGAGAYIPGAASCFKSPTLLNVIIPPSFLSKRRIPVFYLAVDNQTVDF